jgi:tRNA C32,U32 (ribose-2'-O)-methylase TrmJ
VSFLTRLLIPRSVRRAMHPGRAVKRAVTARTIKRASHAMHPLSNAIYDVERSLNTKQRRSNSQSPVHHHGTCTVNHRSAEAAAKCRRTT